MFLSRNVKKGIYYIISIIIFVVVVFAVYHPVLFSDYGYNDDYQMIYRTNNNSFSFLSNEHIGGGRPLLGMVLKVTYDEINTISDLKTGRLLSLLSLVVFAIAFYAVIRKGGTSQINSILIPILTILTPGFAIYAAWFVCAVYPLVSALSLGFGYMIWLGIQVKSLPKRFILLICGIIGVVFVYAFYQPLAAFSFLSILVLSWHRLDNK